MHHDNLLLFGYKSSGKSYFGKLLAQELERPFIDTDRLVEDLYKNEFHEEGTCRQISIKLGEKGFRCLEKRVIDTLRVVNHAVIALGGGAILDADNCSLLQKLGTLIYLEADKNIIKERIFAGGIPSFLDPQHPEQSFERMYAERQPLYEKVAAIKVKTHGKADRQILDELKATFVSPS